MGKRLQKQSRIGAITLVCLMSIAVHTAVTQASVQYELGTVFADLDTGTHPSGVSYITAKFDTVSTGTVTMTLTSHLSALGLLPGSSGPPSTGYMIRNVYLQLGPSPSSSSAGLTVSKVSGAFSYPNVATPLQTSTTSSLRADTEDWFNVRIYFDGTAAGQTTATRFDGTDVGVFTLARTGLTENDFRFLGLQDGSALNFYLAAEIANGATYSEVTHAGSFYVGDAPEATSIAVWSLLMTGVCVTLRRRFA